MLATAVQSLLGHSQLALFIAQAVIIIALARALGLLVRYIGLPMVIAEILTGIVLGPSLLGWLWPQLTAALFPKSSLGLLQLFAQTGLVLFMFLVGLELDTKMVKRHGRMSLWVSLAGIAVPFAIGGGTASLLYEKLSSPDVRPLCTVFGDRAVDYCFSGAGADLVGGADAALESGDGGADLRSHQRCPGVVSARVCGRVDQVA